MQSNASITEIAQFSSLTIITHFFSLFIASASKKDPQGFLFSAKQTTLRNPFTTNELTIGIQ
jgi:hypothetical protein